MAKERKVSFEVRWRIENLKSWFEGRNDTLYSPQFLAETLMNTRWKLKLSSNRQMEDTFITLSLQRYVEDEYPDPINLNYELMFLACDGSPLKSKTYSTKFTPKTVSFELNVKKNEILKLKKEAYIPQGILIVCCRMWKTGASISKEGRCSIQSVIGTNSTTMQADMNFHRQYQVVNFMSTSNDISLISIAINLTPHCYTDDAVIFERKHFEGKSFSKYTCELFYIGDSEEKISCAVSTKLDKLLIADVPCSFNSSKGLTLLIISAGLSSLDYTLPLHLEIKYYPAVVSEHIEYNLNNCETLSSSGNQSLKNLKSSNSEKVLYDASIGIHTTEHEDKLCNSEEDLSNYEGEYLDTTRIGQDLNTTLKQDLTSLYEDHLFCDTKLRTDSETFSAHRCVLSARSPVFKKMFTTDMKERAGECINIPDISSDTIRRMFQFIYTDSIGDLDMQGAKDLYVASDKYDIASLKQRCLSFMKKNLCPSNVCEVLVLADMHQDKDLESAAQQFVLTYSKEVLGSNEWKLFMKDFSSLASKVMYLKFINE